MLKSMLREFTKITQRRNGRRMAAVDLMETATAIQASNLSNDGSQAHSATMTILLY